MNASPSTSSSDPSTSATFSAPRDHVSHSSGGHTSSAQRVPCSITAKQWDTVAVWSWDVQTKVCAICKGSLADQCISCQAQGPSTTTAATSKAAASSSPSQGQAETGAVATVGGGRGGPSAGRRARGDELTLATASAAVAAPRKHATPATLADLNDKCCIAWGTCGHVFHYHCVSRWLQMRTMCPVCGRPWQLHKITSNE